VLTDGHGPPKGGHSADAASHLADTITVPALTNRTKIVATIGPASREPAVLRQLIVAGVNVFRLNFSHGTHEEHTAVLEAIRQVGREMDRHVGVLQDLCGPKMRLEPVAGDRLDCHLNDEFTLVAGVSIGYPLPDPGWSSKTSRATQRRRTVDEVVHWNAWTS